MLPSLSLLKIGGMAHNLPDNPLRNVRVKEVNFPEMDSLYNVVFERDGGSTKEFTISIYKTNTGAKFKIVLKFIDDDADEQQITFDPTKRIVFEESDLQNLSLLFGFDYTPEKAGEILMHLVSVASLCFQYTPLASFKDGGGPSYRSL